MKNIYKYLLLLFISCVNINSIAQVPLNEKGAWGINVGSNIYYPKLYDYNTNRIPGIYACTNCVVIPNSQLGYFFGISRIFRICKIDEKNPIDIEIGLSCNQRSVMQKYQATEEIAYNTYKDTSGEVLQKENYFSLDIKLSNTLNFKEKYGISNSIGFRTNPRFYNQYYYRAEYYLTYSLGFIFYFKKINIMPMVNTTIFDFARKNSFGYLYLGPLDKNIYQLFNFGVSIYFNKPFKKNKDEKK